MITSSVLLLRRHHCKELNHSTAGYTLLELLTVVIIIGVLAALGGAGFLGWMQRMRVTAARDEVYGALREAQSRARQQNDNWKVSVQENNERVEWAVHPASSTPNVWKAIEQRDVIIDEDNTEPSGSTWEAEFDNKGLVVGDLGKITLSGDAGGYKRCVIVKTLLGAMSTENDGDCE